MKFHFLIYFLFLSLYTYAQHEGHNMPAELSAKLKEENKKSAATPKISSNSKPKLVQCHLSIADTVVTYSGKKRKGIAINLLLHSILRKVIRQK